MTKQRRCALCGSAIGIDTYIFDDEGIWYHYWCVKALVKKHRKIRWVIQQKKLLKK